MIIDEWGMNYCQLSQNVKNYFVVQKSYEVTVLLKVRANRGTRTILCLSLIHI